MKITESQLRSVIRQVIAEEQINEGIKDSTILLTLAATVLAAAGLAGQITNTPADVHLANQKATAAAVHAPKAVEKFQQLQSSGDAASGFNFVTTYGDNSGGM